MPKDSINMPRAILAAPDLTPMAKIVYALMADGSTSRGLCRLSLRSLAAQISVDKATIARALADLRNVGLITAQLHGRGKLTEHVVRRPTVRKARSPQSAYTSKLSAKRIQSGDVSPAPESTCAEEPHSVRKARTVEQPPEDVPDQIIDLARQFFGQPAIGSYPLGLLGERISTYGANVVEVGLKIAIEGNPSRRSWAYLDSILKSGAQRFRDEQGKHRPRRRPKPKALLDAEEEAEAKESRRQLEELF